MPALPSKPELEYVNARVAALFLEEAAGSRERLVQLAHDWFPDHDAVDRRVITNAIQAGLVTTRALVLQRLDTLERGGKARCPGGSLRNPA